jgi:DNA-binding GntR family transcriptional regulator
MKAPSPDASAIEPVPARPRQQGKAELPKAGAMVRALEGLKRLIGSGQLSPGEQIRQEAMAEQLEVSRVPLREALNVLADQGVLQHRPNQGYFVTKRTPSERAQITRVLHLLENELMTSLEWPDADTVAALRALNARMRAEVGSDTPQRLVQLNREFHFAIFGLSPHRLILGEVRRLWGLMEPILWVKFEGAEARAQTVAEHEQLIDALASRDRERCVAEMHQHHSPIVPPQTH